MTGIYFFPQVAWAWTVLEFMCGGGSPSSCIYFIPSYHRAIASERQLISAGQVNMSKRLEKVVCKYDRQLDLPELMFSEEANVFTHKICKNRHINPKALKTSLSSVTCANYSNNKSKISSDTFFFAKKHITYLLCRVFVDQSLADKKNLVRPTESSTTLWYLDLNKIPIAVVMTGKMTGPWDAESCLSEVNNLPAE